MTPEAQILSHAKDLYKQRPDWVTFWREVFGPRGIVQHVIRDVEKAAAFKETPECAEIQMMVYSLKADKTLDTEEEYTVITVRLPKSLHKALKEAAHDANLSMNKLCIERLQEQTSVPQSS